MAEYDGNMAEYEALKAARENGMTPKQKYEARKAARKARDGSTAAERELEMMDILDRFTTAVERIADALEAKP